MRILLVHIQLAIFLTLIAALALVAGGLAALPGLAGLAVGAVSTPGALGGLVMMPAILVSILAGAAIALFAFALPLSLISGLTLVFALTAGFRYLRWTRLLGILTNLIGLTYFIILYCNTELLGDKLLAAFLTLLIANSLLFLMMPRRPNYRLTRAFVSVAIPFIYLVPAGLFLLAVLSGSQRFWTVDTFIIGGLLLALAWPFYYNFRTIPITGIIDQALLRRLAISAAISLAALILISPAGIILSLSTILLLQLSEISLLYPNLTPPEGGKHYLLARFLGRLPESQRSVSS